MPGHEPPAHAEELMARFSDVDAWVSENETRLVLSRLVVPAGRRNQGRGSAFMAALCELGDRTGKRVELTPTSDFGGSKRRLIQFYKRFGFVQNKGRNRDFEIGEDMYRLPSSTQPPSSLAGRTGQDATPGAVSDDDPGSGAQAPSRDDRGTPVGGEDASRAKRAVTDRLDRLERRGPPEPPVVGR